ncbi:universal stress protein [Crenobacter sp. SG2303]|uniref:Universal stress protein n=1 Tax=Crenobacter oryzisoli TaxID=3056844 RepID=A0ABT7XIC3_9NEIS|nr:universal stress protein [Crenobacter sp. SG2303]MDN0073517.1 universal stress protein [Crenobacter sp. SG2303]
MYQRILVPIDGSETAQRGLEEAIALASRLGAKIRLFHVVDSLAVYVGMADQAALDEGRLELRADGLKLLQEARQRVAETGVQVDARLLECAAPSIGELILDEVRLWSADLIVMGTHGHKGMRHLVLGSDAEYVVRRSPVPVLLVRATG